MIVSAASPDPQAEAPPAAAQQAPRWRKRLWVVGVYALVSILATAPAWVDGSRLVGGGDMPDWTGTAWAFWWTRYALDHGMNPFDGSWDFYPVGQRPLAQYNLLDAFLAAPLLKLFGPRLGYNLFAVGTLFTSALGAHLLARIAGASRLAALFAAISLQISSLLTLELTHGRLSQALLIFWLLALAGVVKIARGEGRWWIAVLTGVCGAATALTYWYYALFLFMAALPIWIAEWRQWEWKRWALGLLAAGVTLAICMPYVRSLQSVYADLPGVERGFEEWMTMYGPLTRQEFGLAMAIDQSHWPLWPLLHTENDPEDKRISLAVLGLGLAAAFTPAFRGRRRWLVVAGLGWLLTLGPFLKWTAREPFPLALPYLALYEYVPFFKRFWWPHRMDLLVWVGLLVLAAVAFDHFSQRWPTRRRQLVAGLLLLTVAEAPLRNRFLPTPAAPPREYDAALYAQVDGAILTLPVLSEGSHSRHLLWSQVFHERPILGGLGLHIPAHRPPGYEKYIRDNSLLSALAQLSEGSFRGATVHPEAVQELVRDGFTWVVADRAAFTPGNEQAWLNGFSQFFSAIWGNAVVSTKTGRAWRILPIHQAIWIPQIGPIEKSQKVTRPSKIRGEEGLPMGESEDARAGPQQQPPTLDANGLIQPPPPPVQAPSSNPLPPPSGPDTP